MACKMAQVVVKTSIIHRQIKNLFVFVFSPLAAEAASGGGRSPRGSRAIVHIRILSCCTL